MLFSYALRIEQDSNIILNSPDVSQELSFAEKFEPLINIKSQVIEIPNYKPKYKCKINTQDNLDIKLLNIGQIYKIYTLNNNTERLVLDMYLVNFKYKYNEKTMWELEFIQI